MTAHQPTLPTPDPPTQHIGDAVRVLTPTGSTPARVVGVAAFTAANPGVGLVLFDTPTAQTLLLGKPDVFTAITLDAQPGVADAAVARQAITALGSGFVVSTKQDQAASSAAQISSFLDVVTYALLGFAGIAVLVGVFLILNTFSMLVAARTREIGLLRALGADQAQVVRSVLAEALVLGILGSTVGLAAGVGLAALVTGLIGKAGVDLSASPLVISPLTPLAALTVGVGVTVAAAWLPARRAARVAPMQALREAATSPGPSLRRRAGWGLVLAAVGAGALIVAAASHDTLVTSATALGAGVVATLLAAVVLGPILARAVVGGLGAAFPPVFGAIGQLSRRNAVRNPRRTGATAGALMIGLAVVGAASVLAASLDTSITAEVQHTFGADFVVSAGGGQPISPDTTAQVRALPGVATVTRQRYALAQRDGFQVALSGVDTATVDQAVKTQYLAGSTADLDRGALMVDATTAATDGLGLGSPVTLRFLDGTTATLPVGAISKTPVGGGKDGGIFQVSLDTLTRYQPAAADVTLYITTAPGAAAAVGDALQKALAGAPQIHVQNQSAFRAQTTGQVTLVLDLLYGLLALAIVIAVLGVINTLSLSVIERTREVGLLGAIGTSPRQIRRLIRLESVLIAVHGALLGLGLGLAWGITGQKVLTSYGITTLTIPWTTILTVLAGSILIGLIAALLPAHRAARMNILDAIAGRPTTPRRPTRRLCAAYRRVASLAPTTVVAGRSPTAIRPVTGGGEQAYPSGRAPLGRTHACVTSRSVTPHTVVDGAAESGMRWLVLLVRVPAQPPRHRVAVWRELRRVGAVSLGQASWAVPDVPAFTDGVGRAVELAERGAGEVVVLSAAGREEGDAARMQALFTADRDAEWTEFLADCARFDAEIDNELGIQKLTLAELEEAEQSLERLRRWYRDLRARDVFGAAAVAAAEQQLKHCTERLEHYTERVFVALHQT